MAARGAGRRLGGGVGNRLRRRSPDRAVGDNGPVHPLAPDARCPCLSGESYGACCGRYHAGRTAGGPHAPTAEALMRSRYSAFAVGDAEYLLTTWHPTTRPPALDLDDAVTWRRLDVLRAAGGPFDTTGVVEFVAHHRSAGGRGALHEVSRFVREDAQWWYLDGESQP
jgi:SEC-C motif-containing protein